MNRPSISVRAKGFVAALGLLAIAAAGSTIVNAGTDLRLVSFSDSYVSSANPTTNYGLETTLRIDGEPDVRSYMRFDLRNVGGTVTAARLQIWANSASSVGYTVAQTSWQFTEGTVTYANAPAVGAAVGGSGAFAAGTLTSVDVTSAVKTGSIDAFVIVDRNKTAVSLASRNDANVAHRPTLIVTISGGTATPAPTAQPTGTATTRPTGAPTPTAKPTVAPTPTPTPKPTVAPTHTTQPTVAPTPAPTTSGTDPVLIGAGDICITSSIGNAQATAALIQARPNAVVFTAGDNSNETGTTTQYTNCVAKSWGVFKSRIHPTPGNHDYMTSGAGPYYAYYGSAAGTAGQGYYSYDLANNWHAVVLNSEIAHTKGSAQEVWLKNDLAANAGKHVVAYWHEPRFSSGGAHGNNSSFQPFWDDLYAAHADIVLNGHDHDYERFALQSPSGAADANGIREFVVGTGGAGQRSFGTIVSNSQVRSSGTFGVLQLTLGAHSYSWQFIPVAGKTFTDSGTQATHS